MMVSKEKANMTDYMTEGTPVNTYPGFILEATARQGIPTMFEAAFLGGT